jgi:hypothetical protein
VAYFISFLLILLSTYCLLALAAGSADGLRRLEKNSSDRLLCLSGCDCLLYMIYQSSRMRLAVLVRTLRAVITATATTSSGSSIASTRAAIIMVMPTTATNTANSLVDCLLGCLVLHPLPLLPRHLCLQTQVVLGTPNQTNTLALLHSHILSILVLKGEAAARELLATSALLARVNEATSTTRLLVLVVALQGMLTRTRAAQGRLVQGQVLIPVKCIALSIGELIGARYALRIGGAHFVLGAERGFGFPSDFSFFVVKNFFNFFRNFIYYFIKNY